MHSHSESFHYESCHSIVPLILLLITGVMTHRPIPVASLAEHVDRKHLNENCGFSEEYKVHTILISCSWAQRRLVKAATNVSVIMQTFPQNERIIKSGLGRTYSSIYVLNSMCL